MLGRNFFFLAALILSLGSSLFHELNALSKFDLDIHSPQSLGTGGAFTSIVDDESAFQLNPAGLGRSLEARQIYLSSQVYRKFKDWKLGVGLIDGKTENPLAWGFHFNSVHSIDRKKDDYCLASSYNYDDLILVGFENQFTNYHTALHTPDLWVFAMTAGVLVFATEQISVGGSVQNLLRTHSNSGLNPLKYNLGASLNLTSIRIGADLERNSSKSYSIFKTGIEYSPWNTLVTRAGFFTDFGGIERGITGGVSLKPVTNFELIVTALKDLKSSFWVLSSGLSLKI